MIQSYTYPVLTTAIWQDIQIQYYSIDSGHPWSCVYIQWGMHGWEVTIGIFHKLISQLAVNPLIMWSLILVPYANPLSRNQKIHYSTIGKYDWYDGKDWNRNFPWSENWTWAERIAYGLVKISSQADYVIDLHTSRHSIPFSIVCNTPWYQKVANLFGLKFTQLINPSVCHLIGYSANMGKESICLECGSHDTMNLDSIDLISDRIFSWLIALWMILWSSECNTDVFFDNTTQYISPKWWCIHFAKKPWDRYKKWDLLYQLHEGNLMNSPMKVFAINSGLILKASPTVIVNGWDCVLETILI